MPTGQLLAARIERARRDHQSERPMVHIVQKLYEACKGAFAPARMPVSSKALQRLRKILDQMRPSDVGLDEQVFSLQDRRFRFFERQNGRRGNNASMVARWSSPISYLHVYECSEFSMGIFCLPMSAVIPLHNHPGMTVLSKLLHGSMHVKAYDWVDTNAEYHPSQPRLAKLSVDRIMTAPCETAVLFPTSGGNTHVFTALTSCAVLDVLAPPYSTEDGRHCTYYRDLQCSSPSDVIEVGDEDKLAWLEELLPPDDFVVKGIPYMGPAIIP